MRDGLTVQPVHFEQFRGKRVCINMVKYEKDKIVTGYVTGIEKYGIFVNLDENLK